MKTIKKIAAVCFIGMIIIFLHACSKSDNTNTSGGGSTNDNKVTIQSMQFQPSSITIVIGSKITWTNMDGVTHTVTSDDGTSFNSGNISSQGSYSFTATQTGVYAYHCALHPEMHGTLVVVTK